MRCATRVASFYLRFQVPVRSVLILLRPKADGDPLTGRLAYTSGGKRVEFEYAPSSSYKSPDSCRYDFYEWASALNTPSRVCSAATIACGRSMTP